MIILKEVIKVSPLASVVKRAIIAGRKLTGPIFRANGRLISSTQTSAPTGSDNIPRCGSGDLEVNVLMAPATRPIATAFGTVGLTMRIVMQYIVMIQFGVTPAKLGLTIRMIEPIAKSSAAIATQRNLPPCDATCTISTGLLFSIIESPLLLGYQKNIKPLAPT